MGEEIEVGSEEDDEDGAQGDENVQEGLVHTAGISGHGNFRKIADGMENFEVIYLERCLLDSQFTNDCIEYSFID